MGAGGGAGEGEGIVVDVVVVVVMVGGGTEGEVGVPAASVFTGGWNMSTEYLSQNKSQRMTKMKAISFS